MITCCKSQISESLLWKSETWVFRRFGRKPDRVRGRKSCGERENSVQQGGQDLVELEAAGHGRSQLFDQHELDSVARALFIETKCGREFRSDGVGRHLDRQSRLLDQSNQARAFVGAETGEFLRQACSHGHSDRNCLAVEIAAKAGAR